MINRACRRSAVPILILAVGLSAAALAASGEQAALLDLDKLTSRQERNLRVRNVVLMIPDGMGIAHATLGRWYRFVTSGENNLAFDPLACGLVRTYWATGMITESAAAATAMATGYKTSASYISLRATRALMPDVVSPAPEEAATPIATVLEASKRLGLAVGLVSTSESAHATPGAFAGHYTQRSNLELLTEQQAYQGLDVVLGGGARFLNPEIRKDKENLAAILRSRGYRVVNDRRGMIEAPVGKLWGVFGEWGMSRDFDRDPEIEPSLEEMTRKALGILASRSKGFFLMVEGSQIDWAAHANDPVGVGTEMTAFDRAVRAVLDFAGRDGRTAVVIVPDHSTGGLVIGNQETSDMPIERFKEALSGAKATATKTARLLTDGDPPTLEEAWSILAKWLGVGTLKAEEDAEFRDLMNERTFKKVELFLGRLLSRRAGLGWASTNHGGDDVPLFIYHPMDMRIGGVVQNTDIARYITRLLGLDLAAATKEMFVPAAAAFGAAGAQVAVDVSEPENPVLVVVKGERSFRLPANKSLALIEGRTVELGSVVVCTGVFGGQTAADPKTWFVPRKALDLLR